MTSEEDSAQIETFMEALRSIAPSVDAAVVCELRNDVLEEAALVADTYAKESWGMTEEINAAQNIADGIRSLKSGGKNG